MYGHPMIPGLGFMALRRAERRAKWRRYALVWGTSIGAAMGFLVLCGLLDQVG